MDRMRTIAVGFDGSESSRVALDWAVAEAAARQWDVHIVTSYFSYFPPVAGKDAAGEPVEVDEKKLYEDLVARVEAAAEEARAHGLTATTQIETTDPLRLLIEVSRSVAMVVVGSRGHGSLADRLLGAVSSSLPAHAHCPTVVVPKGSRAPFQPIRKIVAGVDGSESSTLAIQRAVDEAKVWDAELTAVAAVPTPTGMAMGWLPEAVDREAVLADVREALEVSVGAVAGDGDVRYKVHALDGSATALLTEFSTAVELIVVGSRGRGGFRGLLLGSTSQSILQYADCPVMVVPTRVVAKDGSLDPTNVPWKQ